MFSLLIMDSIAVLATHIAKLRFVWFTEFITDTVPDQCFNRIMSL